LWQREKFLAQNKLRHEVKTTASGLQYEIISQGTGVKPDASDSVTCNYKGNIILMELNLTILIPMVGQLLLQ